MAVIILDTNVWLNGLMNFIPKRKRARETQKAAHFLRMTEPQFERLAEHCLSLVDDVLGARRDMVIATFQVIELQRVLQRAKVPNKVICDLLADILGGKDKRGKVLEPKTQFKIYPSSLDIENLKNHVEEYRGNYKVQIADRLIIEPLLFRNRFTIDEIYTCDRDLANLLQRDSQHGTRVICLLDL